MSCPFLLKTGEREGQPCGNPSKYGQYCGRHIQYVPHELVKKQYSSASLRSIEPAPHIRTQHTTALEYAMVVPNRQKSMAYVEDNPDIDIAPIGYSKGISDIPIMRAQVTEAPCPSDAKLISQFHKHLETSKMGRGLLPDDLTQSEDILGEGTYGIVTTLIKDSRDRKEVVVKTFKQGIDFSTFREIAAMRSLSGSANIIHIYDFKPLSIDNIKVYMPKYGRTLTHYIHKRHLTSPDAKRRIMFGVLNALHCMRNRDIYHRDLKPDNIVLNDIDDLVIIDFGLSRHRSDLLDNTTVYTQGLETLQVDEAPKTTNVQTIWYRAPEILLGQSRYSYAIDVWSVGAIMLELFSPADEISSFRGINEDKMVNLIFYRLGTPTEATWKGVTSLPNWMRLAIGNSDANTMKYPSLDLATRYPEFGADPQLLDLVSGLLQLDPKRRTTIWDAVRHPYFSSYGLVPTETKLGRFERIVSQDIYYIRDTYLEKHPDINGKMITNLLRWLFQISERAGCSIYCEFLTYRLIKAYLSLSIDVKKDRLQVLGCAIFYIASNITDTTSPSVADMVYEQDDYRYTSKKMENDILHICQILSFDFYVTTEAHYLDYYGDRYRANLKVRKVTSMLTRQLCALPQYNKYVPCEVVSSIYYYTMNLLSIDNNIPHNPEIVDLVASTLATGNMKIHKKVIEPSSLVADELFRYLLTLS